MAFRQGDIDNLASPPAPALRPPGSPRDGHDTGISWIAGRVEVRRIALRAITGVVGRPISILSHEFRWGRGVATHSPNLATPPLALSTTLAPDHPLGS
jgi:hypothetical protein